MGEHAAEQTSYTVRQLIDALMQHPLDDEVRLGFGVTAIPIGGVYHQTTYAAHYVVIR